MTVTQAKAKKRGKRISELDEVMSPGAAKKYERRLSAYLMEMDEKSLEREAYTQAILDANDETVFELVGQMVESMERMEGSPRFVFEGQTINQIKGESNLLLKIFSRNHRYLTVRILVGLAEMDVRVGNFKLPAKLCARCGKGV